MINKFPTCVLTDVFTDPQRKCILFIMTISNQKYIIGNVYLPLLFQVDLLYLLLEKLTRNYPAQNLFMGDFIAIRSPDLDRPVHSFNYYTDLCTWAQAVIHTEFMALERSQLQSILLFLYNLQHFLLQRYGVILPSLVMFMRLLIFLLVSDHSPLQLTLCSPRLITILFGSFILNGLIILLPKNTFLPPCKISGLLMLGELPLR